MKYCRKCGVLYSTSVCPKCGILEPETEESNVPADPSVVRKQWIGILIGIPMLIGLIVLVVKLYHFIIS